MSGGLIGWVGAGAFGLLSLFLAMRGAADRRAWRLTSDRLCTDAKDARGEKELAGMYWRGQKEEAERLAIENGALRRQLEEALKGNARRKRALPAAAKKGESAV